MNLDEYKIIYTFKDKILENPEYIKNVHKLTLDELKPNYGLKGTFGLLGTDEWWSNYEIGNIPKSEINGKIIKLYKTGQDNIEKFNTIDIESTNNDDDGQTLIFKYQPAYINKNLRNQFLTYYKVGSNINIKFAYDPFKKQQEQQQQQQANENLYYNDNYSKITMEVSISIEK